MELAPALLKSKNTVYVIEIIDRGGPGALFRPALADRIGPDDKGLRMLCTAVQRMFDLDRATARGEMNLRKLVGLTWIESQASVDLGQGLS